MNANKNTELGLIPEFRAYRPTNRQYVSAGGKFLRINNRILIYGWISTDTTTYIVNHEMLHFILYTFVSGGASHSLDNIAKFGSLL